MINNEECFTLKIQGENKLRENDVEKEKTVMHWIP